MLNIFLKIDRTLCAVLKFFVFVFMFWIMCILFFSVIFRYFLNSPIFWADEMATYSLVCITFLGAYLALRQGKMVKVTFIIDLFPKKFVNILYIIANLLTVAFIGLCGYRGFLLTQQRIIKIQTTIALGMPMVFFYSLIPLMAIMMIFGLILELLALIFPAKFISLQSSAQRKDPV